MDSEFQACILLAKRLQWRWRSHHTQVDSLFIRCGSTVMHNLRDL